MTAPLKRGVSCQVCGKQKFPGEIHSRPSKLIKGADLFICNKCETGGFEPRGFIIIVARTKGAANKLIKPYIDNHRYVGDPITAKEILAA
jgi:hypothetical protein